MILWQENDSDSGSERRNTGAFVCLTLSILKEQIGCQDRGAYALQKYSILHKKKERIFVIDIQSTLV